MISYKPLFKTMIDRDVTREQLKQLIKAAPGTMSKIYNGRPVAFKILNEICIRLGVPIEAVIAVFPGPGELEGEGKDAGGGSSPSKKKGAGAE